MKTSEQTADLFKALNLFRKTLVQPTKDAQNPFFKSNYVTLDGVVKAIDDAISETGLSYIQEATSDGQTVSVETHILHESGEFISLEPLTLPATKSDPQALGSAVTYAKRYALSAAFGVTSDIDDDGNQASQKSDSKPNKYKSKSKETTAKSDQLDKLTDSQRRAIFAKANIIGKANNLTADEVILAYKVGDVADISKKTASELIKRLEEKVTAVNAKSQAEPQNEVSTEPLFDVNKPPFEEYPF